MLRQSLLPTLTDVSFFCLPESVGWYRDWPDHNVTRSEGALNNFSLHFVTDGKGFVELNGEVYTLQKGDAFLYFPLQAQRYYSSKDDPWNIRWVHFYGPTVKEFLIQHGFHRSPLWTLKRWESLVEPHHLLLEEAERYKILHLPRLSTLTYGILAHFMNEAIPLTANKGSGSTERIAKLLPRMQEEACRPFLLDEWARLAGVTPYYFCKLFRKVTQMTPLEFITLCRLQAAKQLLLEYPQLPVNRVAAMAGYPSVSYFNKRFMEQEGMTPSEFRKLREKEPGIG